MTYKQNRKDTETALSLLLYSAVCFRDNGVPAGRNEAVYGALLKITAMLCVSTGADPERVRQMAEDIITGGGGKHGGEEV